MSLILDLAVADGMLGRNPAKSVRLPRQERSAPHFLRADQLARLVQAAGSHGDEVAVLAVTGLRFGEFAALKVRDFDPGRRRLTVRASVSVVGSRLVWTTPKSHRSREVGLPPAIVAAVQSRCDDRGPDDVIFSSPQGTVLRLNNWRRRVFAPACARAGLEDLTPHDLRHTAASLAVQAGANVKVVQRMLGHASAAMTLDVYAGLFDDELDAVAMAMDPFVPQMRHIDPEDVSDDEVTEQEEGP